jgi:hypothetical protein
MGVGCELVGRPDPLPVGPVGWRELGYAVGFY